MANLKLARRLPASRGPLTPRQAEFYRAILSHFARRNCVPAIRELGRELGVASPNGVMGQLLALEAKGLLAFDRGEGNALSRSYAVVGLRAHLSSHVAAFAAAKLREIDARA